MVITFNWKDGSKTVTLAELEAADGTAEKSAESGNVLQINDFKSSHLDDNRPPAYKASNTNGLLAFYFIGNSSNSR